MPLGTLGASLLENLLSGNEVIRAGYEVLRACDKIKRRKDFLCCLIL